MAGSGSGSEQHGGTVKQPARWRANLSAALNLALFGAALFALDRVLSAYPLHDILRALTALPPLVVVAAALLALAGYGALIGYDWVSLHYTGLRLPWRRLIVPSFVSFAVSNSAPMSVVAAGGVRYRLYEPMGMKPAQAAAVAGFNVVTYTLGLCALGGIALMVRPATDPLHISAIASRLIGVLLAGAAAAYVIFARTGSTRIQLLRWTLHLPERRVALQQLSVSIADWLLSSAPLYLLIAAVTPASYFVFLATFLLAQFTALLLPIPGGLGVFEAVMLVLRPSGATPPGMLAALLTYRVLYYLLPLLLAGVFLLAREVAKVRGQPHAARTLFERATALIPHVLALITFLSGLLLLVTGEIPTSEARVAWLAKVLPLGVMEISRFLGSVVGALLIVLAWGLERRVRLAYRIVRVLFAFGIVLGLLRSFDVRVSALLGLALLMLLAADRQFPRTGSLLRDPIGSGWLFAIGALFLLNLWIGTLVIRGGAPAGETWWHFALYGHTAGYVRVVAGASVAILLFVLVRLLARRAPGGSVPGSGSE